jgi:archaetidylinositol phosphate synthase
MVLNKYRSNADKVLIPLAKAFSGLHPNTISAVSLLFAFLAGVALALSDQSRIEDIFNPGHYIYLMFAIATISIFLNGLFDAVDGKVAKMTKRTSKRGDLFDHTLDRYADILILGGIMLSPFCDTLLGALAIIAVLMTSYMGTQAQALGCGRNYTGLLGRADRLVILILAPVLQMWVLYYYPDGRIPVQYIANFTFIEWIMIWFILAGNITAIHRGYHSWRELGEQEGVTTNGSGKRILGSRNANQAGSNPNMPQAIDLIRKSRDERYIQIVRPRPTKIRQPLPGTRPKPKVMAVDRTLTKVSKPRPEPKPIVTKQRPKSKAKPKPKPEPKFKLKPKQKTAPKPKPKPKEIETSKAPPVSSVEIEWDSDEQEPETKVPKRQRKLKTKPKQEKSPPPKKIKPKTKLKLKPKPKQETKPKIKPKRKMKLKSK